MVKYIIPLALLLSCTETAKNDKLKVSLKEIAVEYEIMTLDEFNTVFNFLDTAIVL